MANDWAQAVLAQVEQAVFGKRQVILWCLAAMLARGHILLEDIPGVGKTSLVLALSQALALQLGRVQFSADVMPADVVGYSMLQDGQLVYKPGPVQCNLFLADELNRATSRTQSALLEAMEENQVTVDGISHPLPQPFIVMATQNPLGAGTQPLPDSLRDRFSLCLGMGYPEKEAEIRMLLQKIPKLQPISTAEEFLKMQAAVADTYVKESVADYGVRLIDATRKSPWILRGASPRTTISVMALAKAWAFLQGRDFVTPEDVRRAFLQGVSHRIVPRIDGKMLLRHIAWRVRMPKWE